MCDFHGLVTTLPIHQTIRCSANRSFISDMPIRRHPIWSTNPYGQFTPSFAKFLLSAYSTLQPDHSFVDDMV
ncbi:hypothetical protein Hanom_Chr12g01102651 [Helianthus anomalus]